MTQMTSRAKRAEATKNRIYQCGCDLIRKHGFDQITVEQISKAAGVSVGTYYYYFESKFDLFSEIYKKGDEYFLSHVANSLTATEPLEKIIAFFDKYADFNRLNGLDMVKKLYTSDNKMFITKGRAMQGILNEIIEQGQRDNKITTNLPSQEITNILFIAARGVVYEWCLYDGTIDLNQAMKKTITLMIYGLVPA